MKHYKANIFCDNVNGTATAFELVNTFDGTPFIWINDGAGKVSTTRVGAFDAQKTFTHGTNVHFPPPSATAIDGTWHVAVDRTSDDYIEVSTKDSNGDAAELTVIPVEFFVYE